MVQYIMSLVKCRHCTISLDKSESYGVKLTEKGNTSYFHKACYPKFAIERERKQKDMLEKDEVDRILKELYGNDNKLDPFYMLLSQLINRTNGNWEVIKEAYLFCTDAILTARKNVQFQSTKAEMMYGIAIIKDKITTVKRRMETRGYEEANQQIADQAEKDNAHHLNQEVKFKPKKKTNYDISDFLD
jgi:hypothetical protein